MNNWRLLLLALFAVIQPIASFTERNLIDGTQQCCDGRSRSLVRDSRISLYGTSQSTKPDVTTAERQLDHQNRIREDRGYGIRDYKFPANRQSRDTPLLQFRERYSSVTTPRSPARPNSGKYNLKRFTQHSQRISLHDKRKTTDSSNKSDEQNRVIVREYDLRHNDRTTKRPHLSRDTSKIRCANERLSEQSFEPRRDDRHIQARSQEQRRESPSRESRKIQIRRSHDITHIQEEASNSFSHRQQVPRERRTVTHLERSIREERSRSYDNNNVRHVSKRLTDVNNDRKRASVSYTRVTNDEIRQRMVNLNFLDEKRSNIRSVKGKAEILSIQRFDERREQKDRVFMDRTNSVRKLSYDKLLSQNIIRKSASHSRIADERKYQFEHNNVNRKEVKSNERLFGENNDMKMRGYFKENKNNIVSRLNENANNVRRIRDTRNEGALQGKIRDNERRVREDSAGFRGRREVETIRAKRDIAKTDKGKETRDTRHHRNRNIENERVIRNVEIRSDSRDDKMSYREKSHNERRSIERRVNSKILLETRDKARHLTESRDSSRHMNRGMNKISFNQRRLKYTDTARYSKDSRMQSADRGVEGTRATQRNVRDTERYFGKRVQEITSSRRESEANQRSYRDNQDARYIRKDARRFRESRAATNSRKEVRSNDSYSKKIRDAMTKNIERTSKRVSKPIVFERDAINPERRTQSTEVAKIRDNSARLMISRSVSRERDLSQMKIQSLNSYHTTMEREKIHIALRNIKSVRNRENSDLIQNENKSLGETGFAHWQIVLYTLQGIYLCGLLMQMLVPNISKKTQSGIWWQQVHSQKSIKVD